LQPHTTNKEDGRRGDTPDELVDAAYFARSVQLTMNAAGVLGHDQDAADFEKLLNEIHVAFRDSYFDHDGKLTTPVETQTGYLLALGFDFVAADEAEALVTHLVRTIDEADQHLRTGFLGTPLLAPVLSTHGQTSLLYTMLFKESYPSWFYSINQGATTMWERWNSYSHEDGFGDAKMNSFNHYAYGAIGLWFYEGIAGIKALEPGYKKILIAPTPAPILESASAEYDSTYGLIASSWQTLPNGMRFDVTVPPNTTANIIIPVDDGMTVRLNDEDVAVSPDVVMLEKNERSIVLQVDPGSYSFVTEG
jgi:alpha-L-rhamnosidase